MERGELRLFDKKDYGYKRKPSFVTMYEGSKLSFKSKKMWMWIFIPSIIVTVLIVLLSILAKDYSLLKNFYIIKAFFYFSIFMFMLLAFLDFTQLIFKEFLRDNLTGKIISIIIFLSLLFKALWEFSRSK